MVEQAYKTITLDSYVESFTTLTLVMGLVFQLPIIAFALAKMGFMGQLSPAKNYIRKARQQQSKLETRLPRKNSVILFTKHANAGCIVLLLTMVQAGYLPV